MTHERHMVSVPFQAMTVQIQLIVSSITIAINRFTNKEIKMTNYEAQALNFLEKTKTRIKTKFIAYDKYFTDDTEPRDIYEVTIKREGKTPYTFRFGQSLVNSSGYVEKSAQRQG
jgi:hypothetical protein